MDQARFLEACRWAISGGERPGGIGTLGEKTLHSAVKYYIQPDPAKREVKCGRYWADAVGTEGIVEIQTRSFERLRPKLQYFLPQGPVTVVYPVPARKTLVWVTEEGEMTPPRKSPLKPLAGQVLWELYKLRDLLTHENFRLRVLLLEVEEYRLLNGWSQDRKRGSIRFDRIPVSLLGEVWVSSPEEYGRLLPETLPALFTSRELGKAVGLSPKKASLAANVLRNLGAIQQDGKRGNAYLYRIPEKREGELSAVQPG